MTHACFPFDELSGRKLLIPDPGGSIVPVPVKIANEEFCSPRPPSGFFTPSPYSVLTLLVDQLFFKLRGTFS